MSLFDKMSKKNKEDEPEEVTVSAKTPEELKKEKEKAEKKEVKSSSFVMGVEKILVD